MAALYSTSKVFPQCAQAIWNVGEESIDADKLRRYHVRLAIVCPPGSTRLSSRFREILSDEFQLFETRDEARGWLQRLA